MGPRRFPVRFREHIAAPRVQSLTLGYVDHGVRINKSFGAEFSAQALTLNLKAPVNSSWTY